MRPAPSYEVELFTYATEISGTVFVNDRVCVQTEEDQRVISVHGVVFSHYSIKDRAAEAYARDTQIRTISHAVSATRPDRFAATRSASELAA